MKQTERSHLAAWHEDLIHAARRWRRTFKSKLPYVRRREFRKAQRKYEQLTSALGMGTLRANEASLVVHKQSSTPLSGDVCLFLSHQPTGTIKPHVKGHVESLLGQGIRVVLILNCDVPPDQVIIDASLESRLDGVFIRQNIGFDFAGWAHVYSLLRPRLSAQRLYLVNDSIVGPLEPSAFAALIERIRSSDADLIGLTEALTPVRHLQSFFLVLGERVLGDELNRFFNEVLCFEHKETVIDVYETRLTQRMERAGFTSQALFPALSEDPYASNDTYFRWPQLLASGFPYVKTSVIRELAGDSRIADAVPNALRASALL